MTLWSPWSANGTFSFPSLLPGTYELTIRSRHADNRAGLLVEESDPLTLGVQVDGAGGVSVRR